MKPVEKSGILPWTNTAHNRTVLSSEGEHSFSLPQVLSVPACTGVAVQRCAPAVDQGRDANKVAGEEALGVSSGAGSPLTSSDAAGCCSSSDSPDECRFLGGQADGPSSEQTIDVNGGKSPVAASLVLSVAPVEPKAAAFGSHLLCLIHLAFSFVPPRLN